MVETRDSLGQPIEVGCTICYPVRRGGDMWMARMQVQQIIQEKKLTYLTGYNNQGRRVRVHKLTNVIRVDLLKGT